LGVEERDYSSSFEIEALLFKDNHMHCQITRAYGFFENSIVGIEFGEFLEFV